MKDKGLISNFIKVETVIPCIHFFLSFFLERCIILFHPEKNTVAAVAKNMFYSDQFERVMAYLLSKLFAAIMIYCLWKLIFYLIHHVREKKEVRYFLVFFLLGLAFVGILWPIGFISSVDNYVTYTYSIRLFPEYWHNAYSSVIFCACLMVFPHPFSISFFQWLAFSFDLGYLFLRLEECRSLRKGTKWFAFLIFAIPTVFTLMLDAYRTEIYALLCIFYVTKILMDALEGKKYDGKTMIIWAFMSALIAVWRTEGIILGGLGFLAILLFVMRCRMKQGMLYMMLFVAAFFVVSFPQKVGNVKYYGSDYSIINSFPSLHNILNRADANLDYEGAKEDLEAIAAVVPIEAIQVYGMEGYRRYNYAMGNADINQSVTPMEVGERYVKAFHRIVLHNPIIYARTQFGMLKVVFRLSDAEYMEKSSVILSKEYQPWVFQPWADGESDFFSFPTVQSWRDNRIRNALAWRLELLLRNAKQFWTDVKVATIILLVMPVLVVLLFFAEVIAFLRKAKEERKLEDLVFAYFAMALLGQAAAIALVMPAGAIQYFSTVYFCSFVLLLVYGGKIIQKKYEKRKELGISQ